MRPPHLAWVALAATVPMAACLSGPALTEGADPGRTPAISYAEALATSRDDGATYRVDVDGRALRFAYPIPKENVEGLATPYETAVVEADAPPRPLADTTGRFSNPDAEMTCRRLYLVIQYPDRRVGWPSLGNWEECDYEETSVSE